MSRRRVASVVLPLMVIASATAALALAAQEKSPTFRGVTVGKEAAQVTDFRQVARSLAWEGFVGRWKNPRVNSDIARGDGAEVYERVAPATVAVQTGLGHGTGFIIDPEGWLLTNHHVIDEAALDPATGVRVADVYFGKLDRNLMQLVGESIPARVYKADENKDLALLKLTRLPGHVKQLPVVALANAPTRPGDDCIAIGHPRAAMLWTVRKGVVSSIGKWPQDMIDEVMRRLAVKEAAERRRIEEGAAAAPRVTMLITDCAINSGDSGGPLVNNKGELIGVTFAMPSAEASGDGGRIAYHIHLDDVKRFIADRPDNPLLFAPNAVPLGSYFAIHDLDGDGKTDTRAYSFRPTESVTGVSIDLDQNSAGKNGQAWEYEFAWHLLPEPRVFYDTDNDGNIDLMMNDTNDDGTADLVLRLANGKWTRDDPAGRKVLDVTLFKDDVLRKRFEGIAKGLKKP